VRHRTHCHRIDREPDPRVRRVVRRALAAALVLVLSSLGVVALRVQQVHLGYELDRLRSERAQLLDVIRQLDVEVATLRSPARIEARARQLGLVLPAREQVLLAREFVAGGTGLAANGRDRVASAGEAGAGSPRRAP
jgi:cell division protein FtsL